MFQTIEIVERIMKKPADDLERLAMSGGFDRGIVVLVAAPIAIFIIAMIGMVLKMGVLKLLAFVVVSLIFCIIMGKKRSSY
jgi:hypothetical protein